ncbi:MAG TPA: hypothetical protein VN664_03750 [Burkholderiales bacterium]|jgi:hypothetical protein|nr:hypothetical protein [Burkholderiales bacterium]
MRRLLVSICLALTVAPVLAAGNLADVQIYDRSSGRTLPVYKSGGRCFVAGKPGSEYQITVRNRAGTDLLAVVSVDGVNVVTGETAAASQSGYVIDSVGALSIAGWRKSLEKVAAFYFTDLGDSYAARTGRPENVGVIGVALFKRKPEPVAELEENRREPAAAADGAAKSAAPNTKEKKLGTGHGHSETSPARYVAFERESDTPNEVIAIHYDTYANLVARGVIPPSPRWPSPFPGGFVPDPPARG